MNGGGGGGSLLVLLYAHYDCFATHVHWYVRIVFCGLHALGLEHSLSVVTNVKV